MANRDCGLAAAVSEAGLPAFRQIAGNPAGQTSTCIRYSLPEKALSMRSLLLSLFALAFFCQPALPAERPNILFITVDDMNCDSAGAYGCKLPGTTPNMDKLATEGLRFAHAHVQVGNCMPSRNVMWSGRYPHSNRVEGFYQVDDPDYPVLTDLMKSGGYFTAIRGKATHSTPYNPYAWDVVLDAGNGRRNLKNPQSYYESTREGIDASGDKPFCVMINISDPHKPFYSGANDPYQPTHVFTPEEVPVPGFLFDAPAVRKELADYYSSVRRADDCVGAALRALEESGERENTVVLFLSDHGMPLPFAKTQLYHHSTHTPLIVRWPGTTTPNTIDSDHMVSAIDLLPTLLDVAEVPHPDGLQGKSFLPLLRGQSQADRNFVFKVYNENSGGVRQPMRSVDSRRFGYIFNPWSDGKREVKGATLGTASFRTMKTLAATDKTIADRLRLFVYRDREEFYDYENDPDALKNLIDDPQYAEEIERHRRAMEEFMDRTHDHLLNVFRNRHHEDVVQAYMQKVEAESAARRGRRQKRRQKRNLISMTPGDAIAGSPLTVTITHKLPKALGEQSLHVTLKTGLAARRLDRKIVTIQGSGEAKVTFEVAAEKIVDGVISYAAFVGPDYQGNLQHVAGDSIPVRK